MIEDVEVRVAKVGSSEQFESAVWAFEWAWKLAMDGNGTRPEIDDFLPDEEALRADLFLELAMIDLDRRFEQGDDQARAEDYRDRVPGVVLDRSKVLRLIAEEQGLRLRKGRPASLEEFIARFPDLGPDLASAIESSKAIVRGRPAPRIPGYEIVGILGRGGMGIVYRARQLGLGREVAVKMLTSGPYADREQIDRFRFEAESVAKLAHPNIVQVYDSGESDGQPYVVMEYVAGGNLFEPRVGPPRTQREVAGLIEVIARAVEVAHRRGIIHRDLKPENILLTTEGVPKVADFGLARQVEPGAGLTRTGTIFGTLAYMAPEQAEGRRDSITVATDVHGLGTILFALLAGRAPFQGESELDLIEKVRHEVPRLPAMAGGPVDRDLETICLKCLQKEPGRRYRNPEDLAEDLARYLDGRPILARPVGRAEKAWLWSRRNPWLAVASGSAVVAALALVIVSVIFGIQRGIAAEKFRLERDRAVTNFELAMNINTSIASLADELRPLAGTRSRTVAQILELVRDNYQKLSLGEGESVALLENKARVLTSFSEVYIELGDTTESGRSAEQAVAVYRELLRVDPSKAAWRSGLSRALDRLAIALAHQGRLDLALSTFREGLELRKIVLAEQPDDDERQADLATSRFWLGVTLSETGETEAAGREHAEALKIRLELARRPNPTNKTLGDLAKSMEKRGDIDYYESNGSEKCEAAYREALARFRALASRDPLNTDWTRGVFRLLTSLAYLKRDRGEAKAADDLLDEAFGLAESFARIDPSNVEWQRSLLQIRSQRADLSKGKTESREIPLRELLALAERRVGLDPANATWRLDLANMRWRLALYLLRKPREPGGSSSLLDEADSLLKASLADAEATPFDFFYARRNNAVVTARTMMAELFRVRGDEAGARRAELDLQFYKIDLERRRSELRPDQPHWRVQYAESVAMKGHILLRHGDLENAIKSFREAVALYDAVGSSISQPDSLRNRASLNLTLADLLATSAPAEALALFRNAVDLYEQVAALRPKDIRSLTDLAEACGQLRSQCRKRKDAKGAGEAHRKRLAALERLDEISPEDPLARPLQSASLAVDQATVHLQRLEVEAARQSLDLTVKLDQIEPSLESADEVAGACMALARLLNPSSPVDRDEFIKVLKLGRDRLRQLQAEGPLHPVHLRMIDRFEAAIARAMKPSL